jgi:hypothetical protein
MESVGFVAGALAVGEALVRLRPTPTIGGIHLVAEVLDAPVVEGEPTVNGHLAALADGDALDEREDDLALDAEGQALEAASELAPQAAQEGQVPLQARRA